MVKEEKLVKIKYFLFSQLLLRSFDIFIENVLQVTIFQNVCISPYFIAHGVVY